MAKIYILQHKQMGYTGYAHGVGFCNGKGSTSSKHDRDWLVENGVAADYKKKKPSKKSKSEKEKKGKEPEKEKSPAEAKTETPKK